MRNQNCKQLTLILLVIAVISIFSCDKNRDQSPIVARVGSQVLTLDMVKNAIPNELDVNISEVQIQSYIQRWIDSQILYQEAINQRVHKLPNVVKRLDEIQRELIVAIFIDQKIEDELEISDLEIEEYFNDQREEFIRPEETRHVWMMMVKDRSTANTVRNQLNQGSDPQKVLNEYSFDLTLGNNGDLGFITRNELPTEISNTVFNLPIDRFSNPIGTNMGYYYLVKVFEIRKKDEYQELDEVRNLIKERLLIYKRNENYSQLLARLKESADINRNFDLVNSLVVQHPTSDSTIMDNSNIP